MHFKIASASCLNLGQSKILPSGNGLIVSWLFATQSRLLMTLYKKPFENTTSIFSFSLNVFYPSQNRL